MENNFKNGNTPIAIPAQVTCRINPFLAIKSVLFGNSVIFDQDPAKIHLLPGD
jgi:hypothetical protein